VDLNCPQYVNFMDKFSNNNESLTDTEASLCSVEHGMESESMLVDDQTSESYHTEDDKNPYSENVHSTPSSSYLPDNSYQESTGDSEYQAEEFPVNRPNHVSLPENGSKNMKTEPRSNLNESRKRKQQFESNEYVPLAEQVRAFQRKTPKRFHTTGKTRAYQPTEHWSPKLVRAKSPNLQAVKRRRCVNVLSREQEELKEAEEMKRYKFHAQPVMYDKLSHVPLPNVEKKLPTKPKGLNLKTAQRAAEMNAKKKEEEQRYEFRARPVPKVILNGPTGLKEKPAVHITEPKTPNFALKSRAEKWKSENKLNETAPIQFKAMPAPPATSRFVIKHEKKSTEVQPFSFEAKDKERKSIKEKKINEEIEKENKVFLFKAQPLPSPQPSALPAVPRRPLTRPEPFNLHSDNRNFKQSSLNLSDQTCPSFKAKPAIVLQKPPFVPEKPLKLPLETLDVRLHTEVRAAVHQKLKEEMDIKEQEKERLLQEMKQLQEEEERREILKLRKEIVHKANPVRHFKPFEIKPTDKAVTEPVSPKFRSDERLRLRQLK